jgi:hypothetical protein
MSSSMSLECTIGGAEVANSASMGLFDSNGERRAEIACLAGRARTTFSKRLFSGSFISVCA